MADVQEAVEFLKLANDADSENRQLALTDLKFRYGDQWPQYAIASRGLDRPQLTINETNTYIKKITNAQRQMRPRGKASPVDSFADVKIAKVITGLGRHIEVNSDADNAYDTAFDHAATMGFGYWRLRTDYISDDSFDQDIFIDVVDNPFTVYFDPMSSLPDGSDAQKCLVTDLMGKKAFEKAYPGANLQGFSERGTGDTDVDWSTQHEVRIAEYFYIERIKAKLVMLSNGDKLWSDQMPDAGLLEKAALSVVGERESRRSTVRWQKQTSLEILEEKTLPGRWIPVVPVYWTRVIIQNKRVIQGLVRPAMDPQRMVNFWQTAITESIALAPKAKWVMAEGQDEGHENEWKAANVSAYPILKYKITDVSGQSAPPPERVAPEPPPTGAMEAAFLATQNLSRVMGVFDPAVRGGAQHKSDRTLQAEASQSENTNFDGYDNLTRSIKHTWRIMLSWFPTVYDTQRVMRIIGEDGKEKLVTINEKAKDEMGAVQKVLNDVTVGTYDVVMETGPGYDTKRKEGVAATMELMQTPVGEKVAQAADDLIVRQMDFPGADVIADRLAAANPLSKVDEMSDIPPGAQMQIKALQQALQKAGNEIQQLQMQMKYRTDVQATREAGETHREQMRLHGKLAGEVIGATRAQHDVEVRAMSAQNVEEIKAVAALLLKHIDTAQLEREISARNIEEQVKAAEPTPADRLSQPQIQ